MTRKPSKKSSPTFDPDRVRDISVVVYKERLGKYETEKMLKGDADGGAKLRDRAGSFDVLTRAYMRALGV